MPAISVKSISKKFKVYFDKSQSLKEKLLFQNRNHHEDRWVLEDVSFEVEKGEAIGLIGRNGSGKSTLLKLLSRIMYPEKGNIQITGRVSSLIELGAGFHPDMSGRENIYTNASIFGLSHLEIEKRIGDIIQFSELEEFIDNPVRTYSSGMYMRLAFAVAIHVDADVLLVDEILSVGDASFQTKCFNKMREIKASGTTIVIVSHSLAQIEQICSRTIWIENGLVKMEGSPFDVHPFYMGFMGEKSVVHQVENIFTPEMPVEEESGDAKNRWGSRDVEITGVRLFTKDQKESYVFKVGDFMRVEVDYKVNKMVKNPVVGIGVFRNDGVHCYGVNTLIDRKQTKNLIQDGKLSVDIFSNKLLTGEYLLDVAFTAEDGFVYDYIKGVLKFNTYSTLSELGIVRLDHSWDV